MKCFDCGNDQTVIGDGVLCPACTSRLTQIVFDTPVLPDADELLIESLRAENARLKEFLWSLNDYFQNKDVCTLCPNSPITSPACDAFRKGDKYCEDIPGLEKSVIDAIASGTITASGSEG